MAKERDGGGWFDWLPWRGKEPEPEPVVEAMTVLGMDPLFALILLVAVLGSGVALYTKPHAFMRGFAEVLGGAMGAIIGTIVGGAVLVGAAVVYFDAAGVSILVILAIVGVIALFGFLAGGGG